MNPVAGRRSTGQTGHLDPFSPFGVLLPDWQNGFEHDPEESTRVRLRLLKELAATGEQLVATHLPFPSLCHVAEAGNAFRFVPSNWEY